VNATRRAALIAFIDVYWRDNWTSPTVREIGKAMDWSPSNAHVHLQNLVNEGFLESKRLSRNRVLYRRSK